MNDSFLGESSALDSKSKHQLTNIHPLVPRMGQMLYPTFPILVKTFLLLLLDSPWCNRSATCLQFEMKALCYKVVSKPNPR